MNHLFICREYPPAPFPPGGVGAYVRHIAGLFAEGGETVHVVAQRWEGAPLARSESHKGRLIVHRLSLDEPIGPDSAAEARVLRGLVASDCPSQAFSWQAAKFTEFLVKTAEIDLIEAPEWEASLYCFQVRRALGLGPPRQPPCIVHLHSSSAAIFEHNDWDLTLTDYSLLRRFEEYTVQAADALLCPSRFMARDAERLFNIPEASIQVIPYPLGDVPSIERSAEVWRRDSVCYVGRLELRKGIVEFVEAAVEVAQSRQSATFHFFGSDTSLTGGPGSSVREHLDGRIPRALRPRFHFHGSQPRTELLRALGQASIAVVPSRWDNLPYSCIEAMCTGLPVVTSSNGGMAELVADGNNGWIAPQATAAGFASALRRAVAASSDERAAMGREAEIAVRRICGNASVLDRHLEFRARVAAAGVERSGFVPGGAQGVSTGALSAAERRGMGVVVWRAERARMLADCLACIARQEQPPEAVAVVIDSGHPESARLAEIATSAGVHVVYAGGSSGALRWAGARRLIDRFPLLRGVAFIPETARLEPRYSSACESIFRSHPNVGMVSAFAGYGNGSELHAPLPPSSVAESMDGDAPCIALSTAALLSASWNWTGVTYPDVLVSIVRGTRHALPGPNSRPRRYSAMALAQRSSLKITLIWFLAASPREKARRLWQVLLEPSRTMQWVGWQLRSLVSGTR